MSLKHSSTTDLPGPWSHRLVHVRGQRLHVAECGAGTSPLVLFIHGSTGGWFEWRRVLPLLADADLHLVAVSLRGYAPSDRTPKGYSPGIAADDVSGVIRALGHRSAVVVGQGFGAWVGWTLHARQPSTVRHLIACGAAHPLTWSSQMTRPWTRGFYGTLARTLRRSFSTSWSSLPTRMQRRLRGKEDAKSKIVDYLVATAMADTGNVSASHVGGIGGADDVGGVRRFADTELGRETAELMRNSLNAGAIYPALEHSDWWIKPWPPALVRWLAELRKVPLPASTLLVGSVDSKTPLDLVEHSLPDGSEPIIIDGAGHYLPVEAAEAIAAAVLTACSSDAA